MADKKEEQEQKCWLGTRTKNEQRPNENYEQAENKELIERTKKHITNSHVVCVVRAPFSSKSIDNCWTLNIYKELAAIVVFISFSVLFSPDTSCLRAKQWDTKGCKRKKKRKKKKKKREKKKKKKKKKKK